MQNLQWDNMEIDDLKRMKQWKSLMGFLNELKLNVIRRIGKVTSTEEIVMAAAEFRVLNQIIDPLMLPPVDRSDY